MDTYIELVKEKKIIDNFPMKLNEKEIELGEDVKNKVDVIIERFGKKDSKKLEIETLNMLGLNLESKKVHFGKKVESLIPV
jgi:hypothetical protein